MPTPTAIRSGARKPAPAVASDDTQTRFAAAVAGGVLALVALVSFLLSTSSGKHLGEVLSTRALVFVGLSAIAVAVGATQAATILHRQGDHGRLGHLALGVALLALLLELLMALVHAPMASGFTRLVGWLALAAGLAGVPLGIVSRQGVKRETRRWTESTSAVVLSAMSASTLCLVIAFLIWFQRVFLGY